MIRGLGRAFAAAVVAMSIAAPAAGQQQPVPQPFPRPGPRTPAPPPPAPVDPPVAAPDPPPAAAAESQPGAPTEATLGLPIYPTAVFLRSFDAGRGQRYYLFGTNAGFADMVSYYRTVLRSRGTLVFDAPATHMFEVGRFREQTMAFPPGVTVKDYTWNNSEGYLHYTIGSEPTRFRTIIQIVPVPPDAGR